MAAPLSGWTIRIAAVHSFVSVTRSRRRPVPNRPGRGHLESSREPSSVRVAWIAVARLVARGGRIAADSHRRLRPGATDREYQYSNAADREDPDRCRPVRAEGVRGVRPRGRALEHEVAGQP